MFFTLSKLLTFLCFPLSLGILLLVLFAILRERRERLALRLFWLGLTGLYLCSISPTADLLLYPLEHPFENPRAPAAIDAIVVLGGMTHLRRSSLDHIELNPSADRFLEAVLLAKQHPEAVLVFSGGTGYLFDQSRREAPMLKAAAVRLGVPEKRIITELNSRNTYENAAETKKALEQRGISSFVLITSAFHMKRSLACFHKLGLDPIPHAVDFRNYLGEYDALSWVPEVGHLERSTVAIKEYAGIVVYRIKGYL
jgi:uncharacterized SAM-binding protein YcdF (DUF218 family)